MGDRVNRKKGFAIVTRSSASVTLHLAPSGRGSDLVQASPHWARRSGPLALGVEQARHTHPPPARARALNGHQEHQEDSSWLCSSGLRPASAGGAGCPGCGRLLQPPGMGTAPQNCPPAAYSTASQPLPPPQGLYCGHISPPPTGSRAGARRARLGARTARKVQRVLPPGRLKAAGRQYSPRNARTGCSGCCAGGRCVGRCCAGRRAVRPPAAAAPAPSLAGAVQRVLPPGRLKAAGRQYSPRNARTGCSGCCAGGRCVGRCCAGRQAVRPPAAAAPAPSLAGAVAPRAPNSAGTRHASSLSRGEQAVQRAKRARSRTFKAGSGHSKGIPLRIPSVPPS